MGNDQTKIDAEQQESFKATYGGTRFSLSADLDTASRKEFLLPPATYCHQLQWQTMKNKCKKGALSDPCSRNRAFLAFFLSLAAYFQDDHILT